jgi:MFS transporter, OFA family, oxalate/formate antiporter
MVSDKRIFYGYWIILAAFVTQFTAIGLQNYIIGPFTIPMTEAFGWTRAEFTSARSIGQIFAAFTGFFIGAGVDRYGGRPFILTGMVILSSSTFSLGYVQTLTQWIVVNGVIVTVGAAMIGNLVVNVTLGKWFVEKRGRAVALAAMGVSLSGVILPPVTTWLVDVFDWRTAWHVLGIGAAFLITPAGLVIRRSPEDYNLHPDGRTAEQMESEMGDKARLDYATSMTRREAMRTGRFYALVLAFGLFQISITVMLLQTVPFMTDAGYSRIVAASMISLTSVPALLSKPFWGVLIDRYSARPLAAIGAGITGFSLIIIVLAVQLKNDVMVYAAFLMMGLGWGGLIPLQEVIWASYFGRRYLGSVRATAMPFTFAMTALGPVLAAAHYDRFGNYDNAFLLMAVCNLGAALMLLMISDKRQT